MGFMDDDKKGLGGAPTRATTLPTEAGERKKYPVAGGVIDYFPDALVAVAEVSYKGNEQHNPGKPLHWDRSKSGDEAEALMRHFLQRGMRDKDGVRHSAKLAWRALALLQKEIEAERVETSLRDTMDLSPGREFNDEMARLVGRATTEGVFGRSEIGAYREGRYQYFEQCDRTSAHTAHSWYYGMYWCVGREPNA